MTTSIAMWGVPPWLKKYINFMCLRYIYKPLDYCIYTYVIVIHYLKIKDHDSPSVGKLMSHAPPL